MPLLAQRAGRCSSRTVVQAHRKHSQRTTHNKIKLIKSHRACPSSPGPTASGCSCRGCRDSITSSGTSSAHMAVLGPYWGCPELLDGSSRLPPQCCRTKDHYSKNFHVIDRKTTTTTQAEWPSRAITTTAHTRCTIDLISFSFKIASDCVCLQAVLSDSGDANYKAEAAEACSPPGLLGLGEAPTLFPKAPGPWRDAYLGAVPEPGCLLGWGKH